MSEPYEPLSIIVPVHVTDESGLIHGLDYLMQHFGMQFGSSAKDAQARCATWLAAKYASKPAQPTTGAQ